MTRLGGHEEELSRLSLFADEARTSRLRLPGRSPAPSSRCGWATPLIPDAAELPAAGGYEAAVTVFGRAASLHLGARG